MLTETVKLTAVTEPYTISIETGGGTNVIAVEQGRIRILQASCPDGTCVQQGWISGGRTPIVCLPHRLVIQLEGNGDAGIDAIVG